MSETAVIIFIDSSKKINMDIEVPLDITANDFVIALNKALKLGINTNRIQDCYLKSKNPIALLKGNKTLKDFGLYTGSVVYYIG